MALSVLLSLGTWQVQRLAWKEDIIAKLNAVYDQDADNNPLSFDQLKAEEVFYGTLEGKFNYSKEMLFGPRPYKNEIGYFVVTPLQLNRKDHVFVNRGFVSMKGKGKLSLTHVKGNIRVSGLLRRPDWNRFTPENNPKKQIWSKLDIDDMAKAKNIKSIAPVMLYAENASKDFGVLKLYDEKWYPRNKHKQYAIFWFTMAGVLCAFFGFYVYREKLIKK